MQAERLKNLISIAAAVTLSAVFVFSAFGKLIAPEGFYGFLRGVPDLQVVNPQLLYWATIVCEVVLAALLIVPQTRRAAGIASFGILIVFSTALVYASHSGSDVGCGCFGTVLPEMSLDMSILRNLGLLIICVPLLHRRDPQDLLEGE